MIRREQRDLVADETVGIALPVHSFVMVPDDLGDLGVVVHVRKDSLADHGVLLHLPPFIKRECARLLEQAGWEPNLADVVNEAAQMSKLDLVRRQTQASCNVSSVDGYRCGVTRRVPVPRVQSRDKRGSELKGWRAQGVYWPRRDRRRASALP